MPISPSFLSKGDTVLVISPSGKVNEKSVKQACLFLEGEGFHVVLGEHVFSQHFKFAGTHAQRLSDLQWALDHGHAKAIFCARGGFGVTHIVDSIDWKGFKQNPKWLVGFSDITVLHHAIYKQGFCSIHGPVLQSFFKSSAADRTSLLNLLLGNLDELRLKKGGLENTASGGELVGGNLSMTVNQIGSSTEIDVDNKILFLEEVGESLYHIDRMMLQLKRAGKLANLKGLVIGEFNDLKETSEVFGQSVKEIVAYHCGEYDYPIVYDYPIGHGQDNKPLVHGSLVNRADFEPTN